MPFGAADYFVVESDGETFGRERELFDEREQGYSFATFASSMRPLRLSQTLLTAKVASDFVYPPPTK